MGLLGKLFNKGGAQQSAAAPHVEKTADVGTKLSLRKEVARISLKKNNLENVKAQVEFVLDYSGSFSWAYADGTIQELTERIMALALNFDDDGTMPVYGFGVNVKEMKEANLSNLGGYVSKEFGAFSGVERSGTNYSHVINKIVENHKSDAPGSDPVFVVFITDGDCHDKSQTDAAMIEASKHNIFFKFVGAGNARFDYLVKLDDGLEERLVDNANFQEINDINSISDEELYDRLIEEFSDYLAARAAL